MMKARQKLVSISFPLTLIGSVYLMGMLVSCGCPPDKKLGEVRLTNPQFLQLSGTESITYTNATTGEKLLFRGAEMEYSTEKVIVATLCSKPLLSQQISYYESVPFSSKRYIGYIDGRQGTEELHYYYRVHYGGFQSDTASYADLLDISGHKISMSLLASDRGKPNIRSFLLFNLSAQFRLIADTTINNQRFQQVYCKTTNPTVYFTSNKGVIAFFRDGAWWFQTGFL